MVQTPWGLAYPTMTFDSFNVFRYLPHMPRHTAAERMARTRDRRRRGQAYATIRIDRAERKKLIRLGYLDPSLLGAEKGPALDRAAEAYWSDKLAEERFSG